MVTGRWHTECILGIVCEQSVVKTFEMIVQPKINVLSLFTPILLHVTHTTINIWDFFYVSSKCSLRLHLFIKKYIEIIKYYKQFK